jgi:nucleoid-associated protein YgaU
MGQFEKIVVLIVFFLVTVICVVTMNPKAADALVFDMGSSEVLAHQGGVAEVDSEVMSSGAIGTAPTLRLDAGGGAGVAADEPGLPAGAALVTLMGLKDSWDAELKEYTWCKGDTFVALAKRFYGDSECAGLLRQFNEGTKYRRPGMLILVPVFDRRGESASPSRPAEDDTSAAVRALTPGSLYTVAAGDSLWVISKKVYGQGSRWEEIYLANSEQLNSPDDVTIGMELAIP